MTSYQFQIKYCLWQCLILSYTSTWQCWGSKWHHYNLDFCLFEPTTKFRGISRRWADHVDWLQISDRFGHARLEGGLIKGKVLDLARLVGGLIKGKVRSCSAICASTPVATCSNLPTPPTPTYTKHFSTSSFHQITIPVAPDWFAPKSRQKSYKLGREVHLLRRRKLGQQGVERYNAGPPWCNPQSLQQSFMQNQKHGIFGGDD